MSRSSAVVHSTTARLLDRHRSAFVGAGIWTGPEPRRHRLPLVPMRRETHPAAEPVPSLADVA